MQGRIPATVTQFVCGNAYCYKTLLIGREGVMTNDDGIWEEDEAFWILDVQYL